MVVYTGLSDVRIIEPGDWSDNQGVDGPRLVFWAGNKWMVDAKEVGLTDDHLDYFDNDDDGFVVVDSDQAKFRQLFAQAKAKRRTMSQSGVMHGRAAFAQDAVDRDRIMVSHTGPAEVPGVTDTRPKGVGPMFDQPVADPEPEEEPEKVEAVPIQAEKS